MKTKRNFLAAGLFLAALSTGFGQNPIQNSTNDFPVIEKAGPASLILPRVGDTNVEVGADFAPNDLALTNGPGSPQLGGAGNDWTAALLQGATEEALSSPLSPQVGMEAIDKPALIYNAGLELQVVTPINVVRSKKYPGIEYSGIFVQAARSNPLQLINPFAPTRYGNGEANVVRHFVTGEVEGLKLWRISF